MHGSLLFHLPPPSLYTMDTLLSQLKGQGSPFSSPTPTSNNVDKLLDTIHVLSKATLLVAQQLQERKQPDTIHIPTPRPTPKPTPKSSPRPSAKKTPSPTPTSAPVLSWVPRAPEYYSLPQPNPITTPPTSAPLTAKPIPPTPHTKKDRKPKSKRTKPSTQPTPATPPSQARPDQQETPAQTPTQTHPLSTIPSRPAQTDQREPPAQTHPPPTPRPAQTDQLVQSPPTPTPTTPPRSAKAEALIARRLAKKAQRKLAASASSNPTPMPTPTPIYEDVTAPVAPANTIVNFPHSYNNCPRLPECPAHRVEFAVYSQAYAASSRDAPRPPPYPQPYAESGFGLRAERDTAWWPVPPSDGPSPPGSPVDPDAFLFPPPDDDSHLI